MMKKVVLFILLVIISHFGFSQSKAYIVMNAWDNSLTNYNPTSYKNNLFSIVQSKLSVKELVHDAASLSDTSNKEQLDSWVKRRIEKTGQVKANDYFIAVSNQLSLPLINISRIFFKNGVQTSRMVCYLNIYNSNGLRVISDTIVSRGCVENKISDNKGSKNFYDSYEVFIQDMQCHFSFIKQNFATVKL